MLSAFDLYVVLLAHHAPLLSVSSIVVELSTYAVLLIN